MDAFQFGLKVAELMLPGAQSPSPGMDFSGLSSSPPPLTGPLRDDLSPAAFSSALAKSMDPDPLTGADPRMKALMDANDQQVHTDALHVAAAPHVKIQQEAAQRQSAHDADIAQRNAELEKQFPGRGVRVHDWSKGPTRAQTLYRHFVERPKQTLKDYGEMGRAFAAGFSPKVNPVTGFVDRATDPNIGFRGAVAHAVGANDPNSLVGRSRQFLKNVEQTASNARQLSDQFAAANQTVTLSPEEAAAASSAPKPTMGSYLSDSIKNNPLWLLPAAGLGGLGVYGLYKALQARKDAKKRRRLMSPAAIIH